MNNKDIAHALSTLRPGAEWNVRGDSLAGIEWLDSQQSRPTDEEITAAIAAYTPPPTLQEQIATLQSQVAALLAAQEH